MSDSDDPNEELEEAAKQYFAVKNDLMQAEKDKAEMLDLLRQIERTDGYCPVCKSGGGRPGYEGHEPDCKLAALLARFPR